MSVQSLASYTLYQCTWWAAKLADWVQPGWGNADQWAESAARAGFTVTSTPAVGDIADWGSALPGSGGFGHVAVVTGIVPGGFTVEEGNFTTPDKFDTRTVTGAGLNDLIGFIQPPGGAGMSSSPPGVPSDALQAILDLVPGLNKLNAGDVQNANATVGADAAGALASGLGLASIGQAINDFPTTVGHGIADAAGVGVEDAKTFAQKQVIALSVAAVVLIVLFDR